MATPPEGPALDKERDTAFDTSIAHDHTITPAPGETSVSQRMTTQAIDKSRELLQVGTMVGEYRIEGLLGEGGMGRVYAATHPVIGKRAAVKVLHPRMSMNPEVVDRFVQEARAVNQIGHPNIVDIFSFGELPDGQSYFVMESLKGESLHERIRRQPLSRDELCHFVVDITHALDAAHEKGIIHRDLKPENVFLHQIKNGLQIKLLDFGIAKLANTEDTRLERTRTGAMMGTPKYIAPEQARGYAVDARVDIYSLGVMMFELATGRLPFEADNAMDLVASHLHDEPPRMSSMRRDIPRILDDLVAAMLAKRADDRPSLARVREVLDEVRALPPGDIAYTVPDLTAPVLVPSVIEEAPPRRSRALWLVGIAALGVVGGVLAVSQLRGSKDTNTPTTTAAPVVVPEIKAPPEQKPAPAPVVAAVPPVAKDQVVTVTTRPGMVGKLLVDGVEAKGASPWTLTLAPGPHTVKFQPTKGDAITTPFEVTDAEVRIELKPVAKRPPAGRPPTGRPPVIKPPIGKDPPQPPSDDDFMDPKKPT
jgi:serine/threonine-protein kinase